MNHTHALHALRADASPQRLKVCMASEEPPHARLRTAASQLNASIEAGEWDRVNAERRCELRALVWLMDELADKLSEPAPKRRFWGRIWG